MTAFWLVVPALAGDRVHVDDLPTDPAEIDELDFHRGKRRLIVDGAIVTGSRHDQLDWLGEVFAGPDGEPPASLALEERHRALRREKVGIGVMSVAAASGLVVATVFPPAALVALPSALAVETGGLAIAWPAQRRFDEDQLAHEVSLLHAVRTVQD